MQALSCCESQALAASRAACACRSWRSVNMTASPFRGRSGYAVSRMRRSSSSSPMFCEADMTSGALRYAMQILRCRIGQTERKSLAIRVAQWHSFRDPRPGKFQGDPPFFVSKTFRALTVRELVPVEVSVIMNCGNRGLYDGKQAILLGAYTLQQALEIRGLLRHLHDQSSYRKEKFQSCANCLYFSINSRQNKCEMLM